MRLSHRGRDIRVDSRTRSEDLDDVARSKIADIESGLAALISTVTELKIASIAIPPLGAGHGGLAWDQVEPLVRAAFSGLPEVDVLLYSPQGYIASQIAT